MSGTSIAFVGPLGSGNFGNDASLEVLIWWFWRNHQDVSLVGVSFDSPANLEKYRLLSARATIGLQPSSARRGRVLKRVGLRLLEAMRAVQICRAADIVVVPGMGIFEDSIRVSPLGLPLRMAAMSVACRRWRKPFVLLAIGAERARNPVTKLLFEISARNASEVSYRDLNSKKAIDSAVRIGAVMPDLVFAHPQTLSVSARPARKRPMFVIGVLRDGESMCIPGRSYLERLTTISCELLRHGHVVIVGGDAADDELRHKLADAVRAREPTRWVTKLEVPVLDSYDALMGVLHAADLVIASRYHTLVGALSLGVPTLCLSYAPKCSELMASCGAAEYSWEIPSFDPHTIIQVAYSITEGSGKYPETLSIARGFRNDVLSNLVRLDRRLFGALS